MENMPSTSSRPSTPRSYDVFINHCGKDVKNTLASHIYHAPQNRGICVFLDKDRMETGELITHQLKDAIRNSSVHIAIFSKNYAGSRWCLDELCMMMEHSAKILPVFYDVEPGDLRWMDKDGPYAKALKTHQEKGRYDSQDLEKWKRALFDAAGRSGYELKKGFNGDEGVLVEHIVNDVLKHVKRDPLDVAKHPVGLDEVAEDFERRMLLRADGNGDENVKVVGIVGMGGAGKTTLAKHLFNIKRSSYSTSSFLSDVRSSSLTDLQTKLLKDLTGIDKKIYDTSEGTGVLRNWLSYCQALVVLDDIDHVNQLDAFPVKDVLRSGSLILVTSRDKGLLKGSHIYDMKTLSKRHAQQLFCWHAFHQHFPMEGFQELVERFLVSCDGLPLSLKVFGALVYGNDITYWGSQLEKVTRKVEPDIKDRLRISYDALHEDDREMFLDVACFFIREHKDKVIRIWDGCGWQGWIGLHTLQRKCLIELNDKDCIRMHDQLRDMGRDIADEQSNKPRRLWRAKPDDVIRSRTPQVIRGIRSADAPFYDDFSIRHGIYRIPVTPRFTWLDGCKKVLGIYVGFFCRLKFETTGWLPGEDGLKLLVVEGDRFKDICRGASTGLVWLRWHDCPYRSLPLWPHSMGQLRVLELFGGDIQTLWHGSKGIPAQLRDLNITRCPVKFPKSIGQLKFLEKLVLCKTDDNMKALPDEFCRLQSLKHLELTDFSNLKLLPQNFGDLTNLQHLDLSHCTNLQALPDSFGRLLQLQRLWLNRCTTLRLQHKSLGNICALEHIDFSGCKNLEVLPIQITRQASLEKLYITDTSLKELPNEIGDLRNLKILELSSTCLSSLPTSIWKLSSLILFDLSRCRNLKRLPQVDADDPTSSRVRYLRGGFEHMRNLERLYVWDCPLSEVIPFTSVSRKVEEAEEEETKFPKLNRVVLCQTKISRISISENVCPSLKHLRVSWNAHLVEVEALPNALESLDLSECSALKRITGLSNLVKLNSLYISGCKELEELSNLDQLSSLQIFEATKCWKLDELPNVSQLTSLKTLGVEGCWKLKSIEGLEKLERLEELYISADNGSIWNDIQFLQRLPYSKLSRTSLTTRAVPGVESRVETILTSVACPFWIIEKPRGEHDGPFVVAGVRSLSAMMICILFDASTPGGFLRVILAGAVEYNVSIQEGEWISVTFLSNDSEVVRNLKRGNGMRIDVQSWRAGKIEVKKEWIVMEREEEEQGKILRVWNRLITQLHSDCLLYEGVGVTSHNRG